MREYSYINKWEVLLTPDIVSMISAIQELKGEHNLYVKTEEDTLKSDYIGSLAQYENGTYYRFFDDDFRIQYVREKLDEKELYW
jgi:hypothetical protein